MKLGNVDIEKDVFVIAEIGGNHEGSFEKAKQLTTLAIESGAHAIKFQTYEGDKLVSRITGADRNKHFKKFELTHEQYIELVKMIRKAGKVFMSSIWDLDGLAALDEYLDIYKVGSGDLTNYEMIEALAKRNKPVILSTGMSSLDEVKETVKFIESINPSLIKEKKLILLQCVAMYGDPRDEYANLLSIKKLQDEFPNLYIGYSDHTIGMHACEVAVAMGARVIEKHFSDQKEGRSFRDHMISAEKDDMKLFMEKIKKIKVLEGKYEKKPIDGIETPERIKEFRRAVYPRHDLKAGEKLTRENLTCLRPNVGIDSREFLKILGKKLKKDKKAHEAIFHDDLE